MSAVLEEVLKKINGAYYARAFNPATGEYVWIRPPWIDPLQGPHVWNTKVPTFQQVDPIEGEPPVSITA